MAILEFAVLIGVIWALAFYQSKPQVWTTVFAVTLIFVTLFGSLPALLLILFWLAFIPLAVIANLPAFRERNITQPLIKRLQKRMPTISPTEREAIEAGTVWWEKELFCGRPDWNKLFAIPQPKLSQEEQTFVDNQVETLCGMLNDWDIVKNVDMPKNVWAYLKQEKFFGMGIPKEYGGRGFSALAHSTVISKIASRCMSAAVNTMVPNSLGPGELLVHYGTDEQKAHYLPRLAAGEDIPCFALTAPEAGSDAGAIPDSGYICYGNYEGKEVLGIRLSWDKRYITLAPVATVLGLAIRLYDPQHLIGSEEDIGITLCLIPTAHPGVEIGTRHLPMHLAFMNGPTRGKNVFIPLDWIIGGPQMAGQGWRMLMECLSVGRAISLPALSAACGKVAYRFTGAYSRIRKQFNLPLAYFEGVEEFLSQIAGMTYLLESCRIMTAGAVDQQAKPAIASAIAKYHMTEMARSAINHAMDVHAGHAIQVGPRNILAHLQMAMPISITVEGANILTRNLIIFGQGAIRCHPYLLREVQLLSDMNAPDAAHELDETLFAHVGYFVSNFARCLWYGVSAPITRLFTRKDSVERYTNELTRMCSALALLSDLSLLILGGALKRKERLSARLGDMLSQLYLASTALKYYSDQGKNESDKEYLQWCIEECLYRSQVACDDLLDNFPLHGLRWALHGIVFPFGRAFKKPSDALSHKIVQKMLEPSAFRDRLTQYCYVGTDANDLTQQLETVLLQIKLVDPIWKKFQEAVKKGIVPHNLSIDERLNIAVQEGVLSKQEQQQLSLFEKTRQEIIKVDEFSFDLSEVIQDPSEEHSRTYAKSAPREALG